MISRIAVVVPAADEEAGIGRCLTALRAAARNVALPVRVIVVLDSCTDATAEIVAAFAEVEVVSVALRNAGHARRIGAARALLADPCPANVLLASTDADSAVPCDWLARLCGLIDDADLVLGTVVPDVGLVDTVARAWFARHDLRDGHPHVHAANLAIHGDAYLTLGGWRQLTTGEDVDLAARAVAERLRIVRTAAVPVRTSTRAVARAPHGFSSYLRALGHTP